MNMLPAAKKGRFWMKKRILAFFLAGAMAITMAPTEVFAVSGQKEAVVERAAKEDGQEGDALDGTLTEGGILEEGLAPSQTEEAPSQQEAETVKEGKMGSEPMEPEPEPGAAPANEIPEGQIEGWTPSMGGLERPEVLELTEEAAQSLDMLELEEDAEGNLTYRSRVLGSQKYNTEWDSYSSNYIYNLLDKNEREFWNALDQVLREYLTGTQNAMAANVQGKTYHCASKGVNLLYFGISSSRANDLFLMFNYSNPQYYFLGNGYLTSNNAMYLMIYDEFANGAVRKSETAKVKAQIDAMEAQIAKGADDVQKAKIAHDIICEKVLYDHDYDKPIPNTPFHQSAYSVFCDDYTVCAGYTKAFTTLMNGAGIDTISVTSEYHAWNLISLNDSWYHVDCTWDDADGQQGYEIIYRHFNRSTAKMRGELDQEGYHRTEYFYEGLLPEATHDSGATLTSIGTVWEPTEITGAPQISKLTSGGKIMVSLTNTTPGADIYYTLDGNDPSSSASRSYFYTGGYFLVDNNTTVKAIAVKDSMWDSDISSQLIKVQTYTVTFDSMGGSKVSSQKVISGAKATRPKKPQRGKYIFDGWYTTKNGKTKYNFGKAVTGNITVYAKWKKVTVGKASISKLENKSGKKMKVTFKKVSGAKGYEIRYSTNSKLKSAKKSSLKSTSKTLGGLKKNKKYYVQVRAYKTDSKGNKVYGAWSKTKSVTIRK